MTTIPDKENEEAQTRVTRSREDREEAPTREQPNIEEISAIVVDAAYRLHRDLGPGLLESVYEVVLAKVLQDRGLKVARQAPVPIEFEGVFLDEGFRADLVVEGRFVIELKSVESFAPVHPKQLLTYLRLMRLPLGLLINFGAVTFKEGVVRIANNHRSFAASRLRVNQGLVDAGGEEPVGSREAAKTAKGERFSSP